ncbi:MAG: anthranilate synthase component I family protein [Epsilonproteobacteria bacterium]|nr:anthranilate synthase component I family protein [Campylobacterota bacterium]
MCTYRQLLFDQLTPISIYKRLKEKFPQELSFLFESAINSEDGNYSFIFMGANERVTYKDNTTTLTQSDGLQKRLSETPFQYLKSYYDKVDPQPYLELSEKLNIGYVDGFVGFIGYDAVKIFEPKLQEYMDSLKDELQTPDMDLVRPKLVLAFSHKTNKLTLLSHDANFDVELDNIIAYLHQPYRYSEVIKNDIDDTLSSFAFSKEDFFKMVADSKEMIKSGDVFQILMSNRFTQKAKIDPLSFYRVLRSKNPSPYMFLLEFEEFTIAGSSPEVMVGLHNNHILLRPIAGTRKRGKTIERDQELAQEMLNDEKECAEHLMLVDLGRNDVGRVAKTGTVKVTEMMRVERYSHVMHMVSDIDALLDEKHDMFDLFAATFTAGTMTGAPKIRAMELIADFEGLKRGFYSGAVGYFGFDGNMDSAIAIRTAWLNDEKIIFQAGAGVVADSQAELEYLEVHNKLGAMMSTLKDLKKDD